ncbi:hypothetical protein [Bifidobacterium crudilactis]|jgi:hypothetical protein|uniref:hypothetical protein n=1 Tax=Bifidobacterium crudilactis TaxID=327277 RepID=UPI002F34F947
MLSVEDMMQRVERIAKLDDYLFFQQRYDRIALVDDPEIQFFARHADDGFVVVKTSRGMEREMLRLPDLEHALLMISVLLDDGFDSEPQELRDMDEFIEACPRVSDDELAALIARFIDPRYFALGMPDRDGCVWLKARDGVHDVTYRDGQGHDHTILNGYSRDTGVAVLGNYAWTLQYVRHRANDWGFEADDPQLERIVKYALRIRE